MCKKFQACLIVLLQGHVALMSYRMQRSCGHEWEARIDHSRVPAESRSWVTDVAAWGLDQEFTSYAHVSAVILCCAYIHF